jgi:hypothetical protein
VDRKEPGSASTSRAELADQLRALELQREQLQAQLSAHQAGRVGPRDDRAFEVDPVRMLRALDGILQDVVPALEMMATVRLHLAGERAQAELRNDAAGVTESSALLAELSDIADGLGESIEQLNAGADHIRRWIEGQAGNPSASNEPST